MILTLPFFARAVSVVCDGKITDREWAGGPKITLAQNTGQSNCDVEFACLRVIVNNGGSEMFLALQVLTGQLEKDNTLAGFNIYVNGSLCASCLLNGEAAYDQYTYAVDTAIVALDNDDFAAEARVGFKTGLPDRIDLGIRILDGYGEPSTLFVNTVYRAETTASTPAETTTGRATTTAGPTTKAQTTKAQTTKAQTTEAQASKAQTAEVQTTKAQKPAAAPNVTAGNTTGSAASPTAAAGVTAHTPDGTSGAAPANAAVSRPDGGETETHALSPSSGFSRTKYIVLVSAAALLLVAALAISVYAGLSKKSGEPEESPPAEDTPDVPAD